MTNGESFEDDLRRVNGIRDSLAATRSLGETMIALDARFLLSFIDKLWKVYAKETQENQALQSLWDDMQQGLLELFGEPVQDSIELVGVIEGLRDRHAKELERLRAWAKELEESGIASAPQPEVEPTQKPVACGNPVMVAKDWYGPCTEPSGHDGECKREAHRAPELTVSLHRQYQGEAGWIWHQGCQCEPCHAEYLRRVAGQQVSRSAFNEGK